MTGPQGKQLLRSAYCARKELETQFGEAAMPCCFRRGFLSGVAGALSSSVLTSPTFAQGRRELPKFCSLVGHSLTASELLASSGNRELDRALIAELKRIIDIIPAGPGFKYIRDESPNAFAMDTSVVPGTQGTVVLGVNLVREEINASQYGGVAIAGICAHECAHVFQFFSEYYKKLAGTTAKHVELHA